MFDEQDKPVQAPDSDVAGDAKDTTPEAPEGDKVPQAPAAQEEEFDSIVYNKETVKIPKSERTTYLQKGYNYDKVQKQRDEMKATLDYTAKMAGYTSTEEYLKAVERHRIEQEAQEKGYSPEVYGEIKALKAETDQYRQERKLNQQREALKDLPHFKDNEKAIMDVAKTIGDVEAAYSWFIKENYSKLVAKDIEDARKQAVEDYKRQASKGGVLPNDGAPSGADDTGSYGLTAAEIEYGKKRVASGLYKSLKEFAEYHKGKR